MMANAGLEQIPRGSALRPPTSYSASFAHSISATTTSTTAGLQEITDSQSNARAQYPSITAQGIKRQFPGPSEKNPCALDGLQDLSIGILTSVSVSHSAVQPEPKRKTLAERAGEVNGSKSNLPAAVSSTTRSGIPSLPTATSIAQLSNTVGSTSTFNVNNHHQSSFPPSSPTNASIASSANT